MFCQIMSLANADPPGELIRKMTASILLSFLIAEIASAMFPSVIDPSFPPLPSLISPSAISTAILCAPEGSLIDFLYLEIPIINGLSDQSHPCQIMSDILTFEELKGSITGKTISWLGDGNNNMSNSLIEAAGKFNFNLKIGCPKKYTPSKKVLSWAKKNKVKLIVTTKPDEAVKNSDCIMTDKWISMNDKVNKKQKKKPSLLAS